MTAISRFILAALLFAAAAWTILALPGFASDTASVVAAGRSAGR